MADLIQTVKDYILDLCKGQEKWEVHIPAVVKYAELLADKLNADKEVVSLASWLHDIKKIKGESELHHIKGAEEAGIILNQYSYNPEKTRQVQYCIITHSSDPNYLPQTLEARIVADADALSHFDNILFLAKGNLDKGKTIEETRAGILEKYQACWDKMTLEESKELIQEKYDAIKLLLG